MVVSSFVVDVVVLLLFVVHFMLKTHNEVQVHIRNEEVNWLLIVCVLVLQFVAESSIRIVNPRIRTDDSIKRKYII